MTGYTSSDDQLFAYLLLKDELPKYQVQELLCAYKSPDLHFLPTCWLYLDENSTRHYIKDKNVPDHFLEIDIYSSKTRKMLCYNSRLSILIF